MLILKKLNQYLLILFYQPQLRGLRLAQFMAAIGIFAYMALSPSPGVWVELWSDKLLHFFGNLLLIGSTWVAFFGRINRRAAVIFALIYSMTIESCQAFIDMRHPDIWDAAINLIGILVGFGLCIIAENYLTYLQRTKNQDVN